MKTKTILFITGFILLIFAVSCGQQTVKQQSSDTPEITSVQLAEGITVEAACGECQFRLIGDHCELAVRINGKAYFVDGPDIDDYGDAHAEDGFCNIIRKAKVKGKIEGDRFIAESFELLPEVSQTH